MKSFTKIFAFLITASLITCCSGSLKTSSNTEKGAILNNYKTYAWITPADPEGTSRADDRVYAPLIQQQADAALEKKGMQIDAEKPDAVFLFDAHIEEQVKYTKAPTTMGSYYYGGPGYYPAFGPPMPGGEVLPESYEEGILAFQMFDTKTKKVLWRGWAKKPLTGKSDVEADIKQAVRDIFAQLPIKHKQ